MDTATPVSSAFLGSGHFRMGKLSWLRLSQSHCSAIWLNHVPVLFITVDWSSGLGNSLLLPPWEPSLSLLAPVGLSPPRMGPKHHSKHVFILYHLSFREWMVFAPFFSSLPIGVCFFPGGSDGKASACNKGDPGSIPGLGISPGEGNGKPL